MFEIIIKSLYFFLPAYFANMAPVLVRKIKFCDKPIWEKKLGKNKTWRGLIAGTLTGGLVFFIQKIIYNLSFTSFSLINYSNFSLALGFLLGFGALIGDSTKSYYKRKAEIPAGKPWPVFDQLDFVIGGITASFFIFVPPAEVLLVLLLLSPALHVIVNLIAYYLGIREVKW